MSLPNQINKTVTNLNLLTDGISAELHVHDNATGQAVPNGTTYQKITQFTDAASNGMTANATTDIITIPYTGWYKVDSTFNFSINPGNNNIFIGCFLDEVEQDNIHIERKVSVANDVGSASATGILYATAGQELTMRVRHDDTVSVDVTFGYANFNVILMRLG